MKKCIYLTFSETFLVFLVRPKSFFLSKTDLLKMTSPLSLMAKNPLSPSEYPWRLVTHYPSVGPDSRARGPKKAWNTCNFLDRNCLRRFFKKQMVKPPIPRNYPDSSGKIAWARSLLQHLKYFMDCIYWNCEVLLLIYVSFCLRKGGHSFFG